MTEGSPAAPLRPRPALPRVPAVIGVVVVSAFLAVGTWVKRQWTGDASAEAAIVRAELGERAVPLAHYQSRMALLRSRVERIRAFAQAQTTEPLRTWARERARLFDRFAAELDRSGDEKAFAELSRAIEERCANGDIAGARAELARLPRVGFPEPDEFIARQRRSYFNPLADLSRQNPAFYRAFSEHEAEGAAEDIAKLRDELAADGPEVITPQQLLKVELLGAVAPADDPVLADWSAVTSASDYFETPTPGVLASWRKAQRALRAQAWPEAVAHMQAIMKTTVKTRQPFRAAYGWALIRNRPESAGEAYPFLQESAAAGDRAARVWVADQDIAAGRLTHALRWLEAAVMEGDPTATAPVLRIYAMSLEEAPRDARREVEVLSRIVNAPDAPAEAWAMLGHRYESGQGVAVSGSQAFACYQKAAAKNLIPAWVDVARCWQKGIGTGENPEQSLEWACRAFEAGEPERALPIIVDLMRREPDRSAGRIAVLLGREGAVSPGGYTEYRSVSADLKALRLNLARHFDQKGNYGQAAELYGQASSADGAAGKRHAELTQSHPCESCHGSGKIRTTAPCPTCAGKGTVICRHCDGRGFTLEPGAPPCTACEGKGSLVQDGRTVACAACAGSGKGKGSVIKKQCTSCASGRMPCPECVEGRIPITKDCPECRGTGHWSMAERS